MTEPRHFWRRVFALLVDYLLASAVAFALVWPFLGNTDRIRLGGAFELNSRQCWTSDTAPQELHDLLAPLPLTRLEFCKTWAWGVPNGLTAKLESIETSERGFKTTRYMVVAISDDGMPANPFYPQGPLATILFLVGSAVALSRRGSTPGKRLLGLRLSEVPDLRRALRREAWRVAPLLLVTTFELGLALIGTEALPMLAAIPVWVLFAGVAAFWAGILWYYWPILRWRGAMRHDARTGLSVVRR